MDVWIAGVLEGAGVPFTLHRHPVVETVEEAATQLPFPAAHFLKTVVFRVKGGGWVLAAVRGADQVDYRKLATALGVRRADLVRPEPADVATALGYSRGGVCPIPPNADTRTILDRAASTLGTVYCGAGRADRTLEIAPADLARVAGAVVAPIARESAG